jgi:hypothetical protein
VSGAVQQIIPGRQSSSGAAGTGAFWVGRANTVPAAAMLADAMNSATRTIFLSMGVSLWSGAFGVGKTRHELTQPFGLPGATDGPMRRALNSGLCRWKTDVFAARFYIRLRKRSYVLMFG